jgi:Fe-S-cluster formation regulator IscX/YfhJ
VPLTLRHGDTVGPIFDDMPSGMHSPEFQKLSETRRAETENDRVRLATDALLKAKKPTDIQPRSNSFTDIAAFFTVLESIFGNIFGDKKPQPGQEWTKEDSTKITEEIKDKKPIVDLKHAIPFDLIKSSGIQKS